MSRNAGYHVLDLSKVIWSGEAPDISGTVKPEEYVSLVSTLETGKPVLVSGYDAPDGPPFTNAYAYNVAMSGANVRIWLGDSMVYTMFSISPDGTIAMTYMD